MLSSLQPLTLRTLRSLSVLRTFATHATPLPSTSASAPASIHLQDGPTESIEEEGALRPHLNIKVNPNHGLYAFFRRKEKDGEVSYETVEPIDPVKTYTGRSWSAAELRRKSFKDLHTLWYVLLRERNLLATQLEEGRRLGAYPSSLSAHIQALRCRKSMARIKYVINERRLAYERAMQTYNEQRDRDLAAEHEKEEKNRQAEIAKAQAEAKAKQAAIRREAGESQSAARLAGAGLFDNVSQSAASQGGPEGKSQ